MNVEDPPNLVAEPHYLPADGIHAQHTALGRYHFSLPGDVRGGELRELRDPNAGLEEDPNLSNRDPNREITGKVYFELG